MKIIQIAVTDGELFALTDTGFVLRLLGTSPVYTWQEIPPPEELPPSGLIDEGS